MDQNGIAADSVQLLQPGALTNAEEIEDYTNSLLSFLEELVEKTVPAAKDVVGYLCP